MYSYIYKFEVEMGGVVHHETRVIYGDCMISALLNANLVLGEEFNIYTPRITFIRELNYDK